MKVYVETNFALELAYLQEEYAHCDELLNLAAAKKFEMFIPAFSIVEGRLSLASRGQRRKDFHSQLMRELRELSRSVPYEDLLRAYEPLTRSFIESGESDSHRLDMILSRIAGDCQIIPLDLSVLDLWTQQDKTLGLAQKDGVVYATVVGHMRTDPTSPKLFLNRNSKDFANPDIQDELASLNCKLITSFKDGLAYVQSNQATESTAS